MLYTSTFVRYERRGNRVQPVRVTKSWVSQEIKSMDGRKEPKLVRKFMATSVTEVPMRKLTDREDAPEAWESFERVESRERLLTLWQRGDKDCEPVVREAGYDQRWLPLGSLEGLSAAQASWSLANSNGFDVERPQREPRPEKFIKGPTVCPPLAPKGRRPTRQWNEPEQVLIDEATVLGVES